MRVDSAGADLYLQQQPGSGGAAGRREGYTLSVNLHCRAGRRRRLPSRFSEFGALLKGTCMSVDCLVAQWESGHSEPSFDTVILAVMMFFCLIDRISATLAGILTQAFVSSCVKPSAPAPGCFRSTHFCRCVL